MKRIYCKHWTKDSKKTSTYIYELVNGELFLCKKCEKKLRKQIIKQNQIESDLDNQKEVKKHGKNTS